MLSSVERPFCVPLFLVLRLRSLHEGPGRIYDTESAVGGFSWKRGGSYNYRDREIIVVYNQSKNGSRSGKDRGT